MERIDLSLSSLALGGRGIRRRRPLPPAQEKAASELLDNSEREQGLSSFIASPLVSTEKRAAALIMGGPPAWSRRLKRLDTLVDQALDDLRAAWSDLAHQHRGDPRGFEQAWRHHAEQVDFARINDLVRRHNLYFPAEANLAMDVRTGDYIGLGGGDYRRYPLDACWVLSSFPPDLEIARSRQAERSA
jgi:hypothetical protein